MPAPSLVPPAAPVALRLDQLQRALLAALPDASIALAGAPLEVSTPVEPPVLAGAEPLEDAALTAREPGAALGPAFAGFLDGTQQSDLVAHVADGVPVVRGTVAAAIRGWTDRCASMWAVERRTRVYVPRAAVPDATWNAIAALAADPVDTSMTDASLADAHPGAQRDAALAQIRRDREELELRLAHRWCADRSDALYVDGGLRGSEALARAPQAVGVVKTHQTLYGDRDARRVIFALGEGMRSSAFVVSSRGRLPVASWYLRLRAAPGGDPLWGLVRVEIAHDPDAPRAGITARADAISRRILAERAPTSHPDARWHVMVYGVRDCEVFLKATQ